MRFNAYLTVYLLLVLSLSTTNTSHRTTATRTAAATKKHRLPGITPTTTQQTHKQTAASAVDTTTKPITERCERTPLTVKTAIWSWGTVNFNKRDWQTGNDLSSSHCESTGCQECFSLWHLSPLPLHIGCVITEYMLLSFRKNGDCGCVQTGLPAIHILFV